MHHGGIHRSGNRHCRLQVRASGESDPRVRADSVMIQSLSHFTSMSAMSIGLERYDTQRTQRIIGMLDASPEDRRYPLANRQRFETDIHGCQLLADACGHGRVAAGEGTTLVV